MEVEDICADGCTLKWGKPEDDGGKPIDHYIIERMDTESGRWVPVATTKGTEAEVGVVQCASSEVSSFYENTYYFIGHLIQFKVHSRSLQYRVGSLN